MSGFVFCSVQQVLFGSVTVHGQDCSEARYLKFQANRRVILHRTIVVLT